MANKPQTMPTHGSTTDHKSVNAYIQDIRKTVVTQIDEITEITSDITAIDSSIAAIEADVTAIEGGSLAASNLDMLESVNITRYTSPGRQHLHPCHPKGWVRFDSTGAILSGDNVLSVSKTSTGVYEITWDFSFTSDSYGVICTGNFQITTVRYNTLTETTTQVVAQYPNMATGLVVAADIGITVMVFGEIV